MGARKYQIYFEYVCILGMYSGKINTFKFKIERDMGFNTRNKYSQASMYFSVHYINENLFNGEIKYPFS